MVAPSLFSIMPLLTSCRDSSSGRRDVERWHLSRRSICALASTSRLYSLMPPRRSRGHGRRGASPEHADTLSLNALRSLVTGLVDQVNALKAEVDEHRAENTVLRKKNEELRLENTRLKIDNQLLRDEIATCRHARRYGLRAWTARRTATRTTDSLARRSRAARSS